MDVCAFLSGEKNGLTHLQLDHSRADFYYYRAAASSSSFFNFLHRTICHRRLLKKRCKRPPKRENCPPPPQPPFVVGRIGNGCPRHSGHWKSIKPPIESEGNGKKRHFAKRYGDIIARRAHNGDSSFRLPIHWLLKRDILSESLESHKSRQ